MGLSMIGCKAYGVDLALENLGTASGLTHRYTYMFSLFLAHLSIKLHVS